MLSIGFQFETRYVVTIFYTLVDNYEWLSTAIIDFIARQF